MADKRTYDLTNQATLDTNSYFVVDQSGWDTARRMQASVLDSYFVEVTGDTMTGDLTFSGAFHPVIAPGSDTDAVLLEVTVTGTPQLKWDESQDEFEFSTDIGVTRTDSNNATVKVETDDVSKQAILHLKSGGSDWYLWHKSDDGNHLVLMYESTTYAKVNDASAILLVDQPSTTGAKPVLYLDQADIDLEFIKFVGSSEDSQADRSLVDAADMTTPGALTGWIQIYVEDIQGTNPITDGVYYIPFYGAPSA